MYKLEWILYIRDGKFGPRLFFAVGVRAKAINLPLPKSLVACFGGHWGTLGDIGDSVHISMRFLEKRREREVREKESRKE